MSTPTDPSSIPPPAPQTPEPEAPEPPAPQAPAQPLPAAAFFDRIRALGIVRPDEGRWAAGVASGLAHRWGVDPLVIRGAFVALSVVFGGGLALYGLAWLFLPHPDGRIHAQEVLRGTVTAGFVGAVLAILADLPSGPFGWHGYRGGAATLVIVGVFAWWLLSRSPQAQTPGPPASQQEPGMSTPTSYEPPPTQPYAGQPYAGQPYATQPYAPVPRPPDPQRPLRWITRSTLGAVLLVVVAVLAWERLVGLDYVGATALALALGVLGVGLVTAGVLGRRGGFLTPLAVVLAVFGLGALSGPDLSTGDTPMGAGAGERTWRPLTTAELADGYDLGAGDAVLDLTAPELVTALGAATPADPVRVTVNQGAGQLRVVLPDTVPAQVDASVGLGSLQDEVTGRQYDGAGQDVRLTFNGSAPLLVVSASLGLGEVDVQSRPTSVPLPSTSPSTSPSASPSTVPSTSPSAVPTPEVTP